jgi:hypothetical protein
MVDFLLQETNCIQVFFGNAHDAGIRYTKRSTTCHLKNLSEKISPKKPRKTNGLESANPGLSLFVFGCAQRLHECCPGWAASAERQAQTLALPVSTYKGPVTGTSKGPIRTGP